MGMLALVAIAPFAVIEGELYELPAEREELKSAMNQLGLKRTLVYQAFDWDGIVFEVPVAEARLFDIGVSVAL